MWTGEYWCQCLEEIRVGTRRSDWRFQIIFLLDDTADAREWRLEEVGREGSRLWSLERREDRLVGSWHVVDESEGLLFRTSD
jgi:hypothetical protein